MFQNKVQLFFLSFIFTKITNNLIIFVYYAKTKSSSISCFVNFHAHQTSKMLKSLIKNTNNVEIIIDSTVIEESKEDTINDVVTEEEREVYENSTNLEIKKIEEEIEDPISEECMIFFRRIRFFYF